MRRKTTLGTTTLTILMVYWALPLANASGLTLTRPPLFPQHLDLDLGSKELRQLLGQQQAVNQNGQNYSDFSSPQESTSDADAPSIAKGLRWGDRLAKWLAQENEQRTEGQKLRLSDPKLRRGIPPESPSQYSPKIIEDKQKNLVTEMPEGFLETLENSKSFPSPLPWSDEIFLTIARKVDGIYQSSARWKMLSPYILYYKSRRSQDIRGLLYLQKNKIDQTDLLDFKNWEPDRQKEVKQALIGICINQLGSLPLCETDWSNSQAKSSGVSLYYARYIEAAKKIYDSFFRIPSRAIRTDIEWPLGRSELATVPFDIPSEGKIQDYLQDNIEAEFNWKGWSLQLNFGNYPDGPKVIFQPGVTPHVDRLGGNKIYMDANQPVEEYGSRWTIRHEFGHVLGLPDCYLEFYDDEVEAFVNYQIDITDLMCSRAGDFNQRIFDDLKNTYLGKF